MGDIIDSPKGQGTFLENGRWAKISRLRPAEKTAASLDAKHATTYRILHSAKSFLQDEPKASSEQEMERKP